MRSQSWMGMGVTFLALAWLSTGSLSAQQDGVGKLQAGAATSNITPPLGGGIVGGFLPIPSRYVHDELHARCLVLDDGQTRLALVVCDLLGIHRSVSDEARRLIESQVGIPPEHVLISATHTHSALSALGSSRYKPEIELDEYQQFVARRIADGVQRAAHDLRPAEMAFGTAEAPEHVRNRRWYLRPGTMPENPFGSTMDQVKMNPPRNSPILVDPAGPTDPTISFLSFRELDGTPISVYAAYSLHYVGGVGPGHISADYFGMFCNHLARLMEADHQQPPFVAIMANGTSGDINNINFREPGTRRESYEQMRYVAQDVAEKVFQALAGLEYQHEITLAARYREAMIAPREVTPDMLAWAQEKVATPAEDTGRADLPRIYAERVLAMAQYPDPLAIPLQVLRIGPVSIGTMPCEVFCEIGLEFKERSPIQPAFLVSLSHGYIGYLPPPHQHRLGGYETWAGTNRLEPQASVKMLDELLEMASEILPRP
jgi:neutral ceramidase